MRKAKKDRLDIIITSASQVSQISQN